MTIGRPSIKPEIIERIRKYGDEVQHVQIARDLNISEPTVRKYRKQQSQSLRQRILTALINNDEGFAHVSALADYLGEGHGEQHSIVHLLYGLQKQGLINFTEGKNGKGTGGGPASGPNVRLTKIVLRDRVSSPTPFATPEIAQAHRIAEKLWPEEGDRILAVHQKPDSHLTNGVYVAGSTTTTTEMREPDWEWPQLIRLREIKAASDALKDKQERLLAAAATLEGIDGEAATLLLDRASNLTGALLDDVAEEYLRFAEKGSAPS